MKKNLFLISMAVLPLMLFSCAKEQVFEAVSEAPELEADPWTILPVKEVPGVPGSYSVTAGYDEETKSQLNWDTSTHASVVWNAGDSFDMVGATSDLNSSSTISYTTSSGGAKAVFTSGYVFDASMTTFHSIYPETFYIGKYVDKLVFGVTLPDTQTATVDGLSPGSIISYAKSDSPDEDLHFKNFIAILKFKLSGSVASEVKSVKFTGTADAAGKLVMSYDASGNPEVVTAISFGASTKSRSVTLEGSFEADKEYYIALAPGYHDGFSLTFTNSGGTKTIKKTSSKALTLNRSQVVDLGTISLGDTFPATPPALTPYIKASVSSPLKPVTLVVIPDGFTSSQLADYEVQAKAGIDALFNTEPFKSYKSYFNVWILEVASNESGARVSDGTEAEQNRDCYFRSTWGKDSYSSMTASEGRVFSFVENNCPDILDGTHDITEVPILIIINDERYGGINHYFSDGRAYSMVPLTFGGGEMTWNYGTTEAESATAVPANTRSVPVSELNDMGVGFKGTWKNTLVHEYGGHGFGRLTDEYWYNSYYSAVEKIDSHTWPVPYALNISAKYDVTPWDVLLTNKTSLVSSNAKYDRIGVFQGGGVSMFNRWRSERISCMIDNRFYFSTWQRYLIVQRILSLANHTVGTDYTKYALVLGDFRAHDNPTDPVRDGGASVMLPDGVSNAVPPRPVPMLPPPVFHND